MAWTAEDRKAYHAAWYARNVERLKVLRAANYVQHRDQRRADHAAWAAAHREERKLYHIAYRAAHRDEMLAKGAKYYQEHRSEVAVRTSAYHAANLELYQVTTAAYRARKHRARVSDLTRAQWTAIKALYSHRCVYCGANPKRLTQDHVIPLSKGGHHTVSNVVPACHSCNSRKWTNPPAVPVQPALLV